MLSRSLHLLLMLAALAAGSVLAMNYPMAQVTATLIFFSYAVLVFFKPDWFPVILPALLPVIGFAPWTGWISFEELDLLALATATGGYARAVADGKQEVTQRTSLRFLVLTTLMSISILISMSRGFSDAGGFVFGWFQGYDGAMNSIRIGKSFFLALLLLPLLIRLHSSTEYNASKKLALGLAIGLGTASFAALWERLAFTDLLNFSSDYRSTALFWEMHVGGAALDGWLLLTMPFAIWSLRNSRNSIYYALSLGLLGLATYASLTTFSRGVYLALIVSLLLLAWQTRKHANSSMSDQETPAWGFGRWAIAVVVLGTMAGLIFPAGGYRSLAALLGLVAVSLAMPVVFRKMSIAQLLAGGIVGILTGGILVVLAGYLPKGAYVLYFFFLVLTLLILYWPRDFHVGGKGIYCTAGFFGLVLSAASVAEHWGGMQALWGMCAALMMLLVIIVSGSFSPKPFWPNSLRWQGELMTVAFAVSALIAVFVGGGYMGERFSTSGKDFDGRQKHWSHTLSMLQAPGDIFFGKGLGRFPANYFFAIPTGEFPGTYRVSKENGNSWLSLVGAKHPLSFGDIFRLSQRLSFQSVGPFDVELKVRAKADVAIHVEVCEKHLLYPGSCALENTTIKATNGAWQPVHIRLAGPVLSEGLWFAPRIKMFSLGIGSQSGFADIDDVVLTSLGSQNMLANGEFSNEMRYWFFSSDRDHMPWHAKNLLVNLLFDQGAAGLLLFLLLTVSALWRLNFGNARQHELSPYLTAAIIGFLVVGLFDSLTDVPRLALIYYLLILFSLSFGTPNRKKPRGKLNDAIAR